MTEGHLHEPNRADCEATSSVKRARLDKIFQHATSKKAMTPDDFDYATELLTQCVLGDAGNIEYVRALLGNLQEKYHNNKKGCPLAQFKERAARSALRKALAKQQWDEVVKHGLKVLTVNPWDISALTAMATAAANSGHRKCELCYLQTAVAGAPKDPACNRLYAIALGERGMIDQAITFWHRVEEIRLHDDEAQRAIAALAVRKANSLGHFDVLDDDDKVARKLRFKAQQQEEMTREQTIQQKLQSEPNNVAHYLELAQIYSNDERYEDAEDVLSQAYEASDGDLDIREKWGDVQLRRLRQKITTAGNPETKKMLQCEYFEKDVEVCQHRVERYPNNLLFKYELGYRYLLTERYTEAIQELQVAANDPRRKGLALLLLGQCFQRITQYRLALSHYESALQEIPDRDANNKKQALYLAGRLALAMKNINTAEKHLTVLASLDFAYKDGAVLLEKVRKLRENQGVPTRS